MINFESVKASLDFGLDFVNITFTVSDTDEDMSDYQFDLFRANDPDDPFFPVYSNISDFECNDYSAALLSPEVIHYYKIRATYLPTDFSIESEIFTYPPIDGDRYGIYLSEVYHMYLEAIDSKRMYLLKRKRTGTRCDCYDDVRGSRLADKCQHCFGTGYVGGYYRPKEIRVNFLSAPSKEELLNIKGTFEESSPTQLWTLNYPLLQENDLLVDVITGERCVVTHWQPSYKSGFLIRQTVQVDAVPESSKLFKVPVKYL